MASANELTFDGSQTKLGAALDGVREELAGLPVAGIVLVSDGADTSDAALDRRAARPQGREAAGVHRRRRQRAAAARHPDRSRDARRAPC